jgi:hypothetical protein
MDFDPATMTQFLLFQQVQRQMAQCQSSSIEPTATPTPGAKAANDIVTPMPASTISALNVGRYVPKALKAQNGPITDMSIKSELATFIKDILRVFLPQ